jgi:hypothetical protein
MRVCPRCKACASVLFVPRSSFFARAPIAFRPPLCMCVLTIALAFAAGAGERVHFAPKFALGETLHYRIESSTETAGTITTPIANPEAGSHSHQTIDVLVRLDVLDLGKPGAGDSPAVRIRATYEKSRADSDGDAFDPSRSSLADQYARAEGRSIDFTVGTDGQLSQIHGLEEAFPGAPAGAQMTSWLGLFFSAGGFPSNGIAIGQKWKNERRVPDSPLAGLTWRTESTYLHDERCDASGAWFGQAKASFEDCAAILTRFDIFRQGSTGTGGTPEEYVRRGLRTSGIWTGSGESLDSVSVASGLLVSSTQTSKQQMDYVISSEATGSSIHRAGHMESQTEITLLSKEARDRDRP